MATTTPMGQGDDNPHQEPESPLWPDFFKRHRFQIIAFSAMGIFALIFISMLASGGGYPVIYEISLLANLFGFLFLCYLVFRRSNDFLLEFATAVVTAVAVVPSLIQGWSYWQGTTLRYSLSANMHPVPYPGNAECFPNDGTLMIAGSPEASDNIVQCRHTQSGKRLAYSFTPPEQLGERNVDITGVGGVFGIDQDPQNSKMPGATVDWTVSYMGHTICRIDAHWGQSGQHCESNVNLPFDNGQRLVVTQVANFGTGHSGQELYAGIIDPVLLLNVRKS